MTNADAPGTIVLVGFMGAGKSTVGRLLARELGWRFVDADEALEARAGRTIASFFEADDEPGFRALEAEVVGDLVSSPDPLVVATGGGWAADPSRVRGLPDSALAVWLRVSPEVAVRRASGEAPSHPGEHPAPRPLLDVEDPVDTARVLLAERNAGYGAASVKIETDGRPPGQIVQDILKRIGRVRPDRDTASDR